MLYEEARLLPAHARGVHADVRGQLLSPRVPHEDPVEVERFIL